MKKFCISSLLISSLFSAEFFMNVDAFVYKNNQKQGEISILTPVEIVKTGDKFSSIKITGLRNKNYTQEVIRGIKLAENYLTMDSEKQALNDFKVLKEFEDEYGEEWQEVEGIFEVESDKLSSDKEKFYKEAHEIYAHTCSQCHRLHEAREFTTNQWPHQIETMSEYISFEPEVKSLVTKYLQQNSKDFNKSSK